MTLSIPINESNLPFPSFKSNLKSLSWHREYPGWRLHDLPSGLGANIDNGVMLSMISTFVDDTGSLARTFLLPGSFLHPLLTFIEDSDNNTQAGQDKEQPECAE